MPGLHDLYLPGAFAVRLGVRPGPSPAPSAALVLPLDGAHASLAHGDLLRVRSLLHAVHGLGGSVQPVRATRLHAPRAVHGLLMQEDASLDPRKDQVIPVLPSDAAAIC